MLLSTDVDVRSSEESRKVTPLHLAARFNSDQTGLLLIQNGADASKKSAFGQNALHYAARRGSLDMARVSLPLHSPGGVAFVSRLSYSLVKCRSRLSAM